MSNHAALTQTLSVRRTLGVRAAIIAVSNEIAKGLVNAWGERTQIVIELPLFIIFFLLISLILGQGEEIARGRLAWAFHPRQVSWLFLGFVPYSFFYLQTVKLFWRLLGEIQTGTLEQVYLSPLPSWLVAMAGRVVAAVVETLLVVGALYLAVYLVVPFHVNWRLEMVLPLAFIVVGGVGHSLIIGGLTLIWKRIEMINDLLLTTIMVFSGALVPLAPMPGWMAVIGRLLPLTHGVASLRSVLLDGRSFTVLGGDGSLIWLTGAAAVWFLAGVLFFQWAEAIAKGQGSLGRY
jgi:ABC-type polysaccharide/polyol phosphate export permease